MDNFQLWFIKALLLRCNVPGCDQTPQNYSQSWVPNAIPYASNGLSEKCKQYEQIHLPDHPSECNRTDIFDRSQTIICNNFIYDTSELTLQNEVCAIYT